MTDGKKAFQLFYTTAEKMIDSELSTEETGQLFRAIVKYEIYGEIPDLKDRTLRIICKQACEELDRNREKYSQKCVCNQAKANKRHHQISYGDYDLLISEYAGNRNQAGYEMKKELLDGLLKEMEVELIDGDFNNPELVEKVRKKYRH